MHCIVIVAQGRGVISMYKLIGSFWIWKVIKPCSGYNYDCQINALGFKKTKQEKHYLPCISMDKEAWANNYRVLVEAPQHCT